MANQDHVVSDPDDHSSNPSNNRPFSDVARVRLSRRGVLRGTAAAAAVGFLGAGSGLANAGTTTPAAASAARAGRLLGFKAVPTSDADAFTVPEGYTADVLIPWGTPVRPDGPAWRKDASNTAAEQAEQIGMNHDGMHYFPIGNGPAGNRRGLLVLNHEYIDTDLIYPDGDDEMTQAKVDKALEAHGLALVQIEEIDGTWQVTDSPYNRRVTGTTPMTISGPVTPDHPKLQSNNAFLGTLNNCSHGVTPWNTYVAAEENFNSYFGTEDASWKPDEVEERYGIDNEGFGYRWHEVDERFDVALNGNELNRFGWPVEVDPFDPDATPVKRSALGRFKHESVTFTEIAGHVVAYSGDDQDGDYVYKYVSEKPWRALQAQGKSPLDHGTLFVARFDDDGSGEWLPLVFGRGPLTAENGWEDQADVLIRTRLAADALGATKMDRPEWVAIHPKTGEVYVTLTNGTGWEGEANPRTPNPYGHIISWREDHRGKPSERTAFEWDIFVLAGDPAYDEQVDLDEDSMFGSPDGLWFDADGRLWIQTDISNSAQNLAERGYDNIANNAMLAADPETKEIRRFLVGPRGCEITGVITTPDQRTMFVNVQHPGEDTEAWGGAPTPDNPRLVSNWPDFDPEGRPRSATVVIRKKDGGVVGT